MNSLPSRKEKRSVPYTHEICRDHYRPKSVFVNRTSSIERRTYYGIVYDVFPSFVIHIRPLDLCGKRPSISLTCFRLEREVFIQSGVSQNKEVIQDLDDEKEGVEE